jgi:hypothetical protein
LIGDAAGRATTGVGLGAGLGTDVAQPASNRLNPASTAKTAGRHAGHRTSSLFI